jgi:putative ABC transport system ATP-binding protein
MDQRTNPVSPIVSLREVSLTLDSRAGPVNILRGVTLDLAAQQSTAIVGQSGSGKTSLLMVIAGLERATSGRVNVVGHDFMELGEDALTRVRGEEIGIVFQSFHLVPTLTALENVALPLDLTGFSDADGRAKKMLEEVGLGHRIDHYPAQLSGGEQQRVALARALAPEPKLLLADEPTGNLDAHTSRQIVDLIFALQRKHGTTLVLVTHDEKLAGRCGRVVSMQDGSISQTPEKASAIAS